jgi:hypothetical protein
MATVGIVGGLGPESTVDYYRRDASIAGVLVLDTPGLPAAAIVQRLRRAR